MSSPAVQPRRDAALAAFVALMLLLKLRYAIALRVDSDEPQHLHVVWAWLQGLLPYRDVFDNHAQLFQVLSAPVLRLVGERADVVFWMRLPMIPLWLAALALTARLARTLFDDGVARGAVVLLALQPLFFTTTTEYRPDVLWALLWVAFLAVLLEAPFTKQRAFVAGLLAGAAVATSLKTLALLGAFAGAVAVLALPPRRTVWLAAGLIIFPALFAGFFVARGAGADLVDNVWLHNLIRPGEGGGVTVSRSVTVLGFAIVASVIAWRIRRADAALGKRRALLFLASAFALLVIAGEFPVHTAQTELPLVPPFVILVAALAAHVARRLHRERLAPAAIAALGVACIVSLIVEDPPWRNGTRADRTLRARVLELADAGAPVMDAKGEAVFRPRPVYWVLEKLTLAHVKRGDIDLDLPQQLARTRTAVVVTDRVLQDAPTREFLARNYVAVAPRLLVAGRTVKGRVDGAPVQFPIEIGARYRVAGPAADLRIDGRRATGSIELAPGEHVLEGAAPDQSVTLVYARALERGLSPRRRL